MLTCFSQCGPFPPGVWREEGHLELSVVERHPLFDDRQRRGHPAGCGSSTRLELHGWLGGEDLVDGDVVLLDACG